jgi:hypothetical protein
MADADVATPRLPALGPPVQIAYAVPDVEDAARRWARDAGAGPFLVRPHIALTDVVYRGRPGQFDHTSAYGQWGPIQVELVQDHGTSPSVVREMYAPDESGLHHLAFFVADPSIALDQLAARGYETAMSARTPGGVEFHFVDARATHGHHLELYRPTVHLRRFYERVAALSHGWDGTDPIRFP